MRTICLTGIMLVAGLATLAAANQPELSPQLKKLHIVMVFDTADTVLRRGLEIDAGRLRSLWVDTIPKGRYSLTVLRDRKANPQDVLAHLKSLKLTQDEGVVFFYGGHGATDPLKGHYLLFTGEKVLLRSELRKTLEGTGAGLVVLMSDCCSTLHKLPPPPPAVVMHEDNQAPKWESKDPDPLVKQLLFQARGTIDATAATDNASWSDNEEGGLFTRVVCRMLHQPIKTLDSNKDGSVTWPEFFPQLQQATEKLFRDWSKELKTRGEEIPEKTQKPHAFALGRQAPAIRYAVVGVENGTVKELALRFRWEGGDRWETTKLKIGERRTFYASLNTEGKIPQWEAKIDGIERIQTLTASKWQGETEPTFGAAGRNQYRVRPIK